MDAEFLGILRDPRSSSIARPVTAVVLWPWLGRAALRGCIASSSCNNLVVSSMAKSSSALLFWRRRGLSSLRQRRKQPWPPDLPNWPRPSSLLQVKVVCILELVLHALHLDTGVNLVSTFAVKLVVSCPFAVVSAAWLALSFSFVELDLQNVRGVVDCHAVVLTSMSFHDLPTNRDTCSSHFSSRLGHQTARVLDKPVHLDGLHLFVPVAPLVVAEPGSVRLKLCWSSVCRCNQQSCPPW